VTELLKKISVVWNALVSESVVYLIFIFRFGIVGGPNPLVVAC
jgi:hypothetical protein